MSHSSVALIVDIVRSRDIADREQAQRDIIDAFRRASEAVHFAMPLWATVGDEFQAVFGSTAEAVQATTIVRLALPDGLDCRFGLGSGEVRVVGGVDDKRIQDGSAWWNSRSAIDEAHRREDKANPTLRSWFSSGEPTSATDALVNAYLVLRDETISSMRSRDRRVVLGMLTNRSQLEIAREEGITQSAVSQSLRRSGGIALLTTLQLLGAAETAGSADVG